SGTTGNDTIIGNSSDNILVGNSGTDTLTGGGGNDSIDPGNGNLTPFIDYLGDAFTSISPSQHTVLHFVVSSVGGKSQPVSFSAAGVSPAGSHLTYGLANITPQPPEPTIPPGALDPNTGAFYW